MLEELKQIIEADYKSNNGIYAFVADFKVLSQYDAEVARENKVRPHSVKYIVDLLLSADRKRECRRYSASSYTAALDQLKKHAPEFLIAKRRRNLVEV